MTAYEGYIFLPQVIINSRSHKEPFASASFGGALPQSLSMLPKLPDRPGFPQPHPLSPLAAEWRECLHCTLGAVPSYRKSSLVASLHFKGVRERVRGSGGSGGGNQVLEQMAGLSEMESGGGGYLALANRWQG